MKNQMMNKISEFSPVAVLSILLGISFSNITEFFQMLSAVAGFAFIAYKLYKEYKKDKKDKN